jgi:hypothetical protein
LCLAIAWLEKGAGLHSGELRWKIWDLKNSGQMSHKNLLTYEERDDERNYHYFGLCGNLVSPAGLYSA